MLSREEDSLNRVSHEERSLKIDVSETNNLHKIPEDISEMTPIKKPKDFIENLDSKDMSDLPGLSRHSI